MKKIVSFLLAAVICVQCTLMSSAQFNAPELSRESWDELYSSLCDINTLPTLCVGADETQLNITWHSDNMECEPTVRLADNASMENAVTFTGETVAAETENQVVCRTTITGIEPNSTYYYQWNTGDGYSDAYKYESKNVDSYKAVVIGDIQIGGQSSETSVQSDTGFKWNNLLSEALTENPDISFLLSPGDNTSTGKTASEWQTLLMPEAMRELPVALAIGNHDKKGMTYNYYTNMPNEYYGKYFEGLDRDFYFTYGDVLYLFYDATSSDATDHMAMTKKAVAENPDCKWRIAVMHQALFGAGYSIFSAETQILLNAVFTPIFDTFDVDLVLTGHSHLQGRSHFMYESAVVGRAESGKTYKDPKGTVFLNSNAVCGTESSYDFNSYYSAYEFVENDVTTYTTLEFVEDEMRIVTMRGDNSEVLDSLTIEKTDNDHNDNNLFKRIQRFLYKFVELCGRVYQVIDNRVVEIRGGHF
ncbi:MAG: metallophosphoesterase [Acutalibacteraceae bacterium]